MTANNRQWPALKEYVTVHRSGNRPCQFGLLMKFVRPSNHKPHSLGEWWVQVAVMNGDKLEVKQVRYKNVTRHATANEIQASNTRQGG